MYEPNCFSVSAKLTGAQEQSTTDIWRCICDSVKQAVTQSNIDANSIRGIGFDATCSLAVFTHDTDEPVSVTGPKFNESGNDHNVVLWLDHRPVEETKKINDTNHNLLRYVGGTMSIEMEIPKVLWLKNNMPKELFDRCKFYDLTDALEHLASFKSKRCWFRKSYTFVLKDSAWEVACWYAGCVSRTCFRSSPVAD